MLTKVFRILTITLVLTSAMIPRAATGDDVATARDLPPLTPKAHPRILTMLDETSTSDCIGRPVTPLCAVETKMACFLRGNNNLCEVASGENFNLSNNMMAREHLWYRVTKTAIVDDRHFPWRPIDHIYEPSRIIPSVKVGDVRIETRYGLCYDAPSLVCDKYGSVIIYIIRKVDGFWQLQGWIGIFVP